MHGGVDHRLTYQPLVVQYSHIPAAAYVAAVEVAIEADELRIDAGGVDLVLDDLREHRMLRQDAVDGHVTYGLMASVVVGQVAATL
jgi:hypothetical protein